jgi:N-acetylmuramoyl-L-alanine amidase
VLGHSDVAPGRKIDPGERFPWGTLAAAGIGHFVEPVAIADGRFFQKGDSGPPIEALQAMLALYGYGVEVTGAFDQSLEDTVAAFQRHFRQARVDGIADRSTIETLKALLDALP